MADQAKIAGVSTITVSRALRGGDNVNPGTRKLILDRARHDGYRLNLPARNLRIDRSQAR